MKKIIFTAMDLSPVGGHDGFQYSPAVCICGRHLNR